MQRLWAVATHFARLILLDACLGNCRVLTDWVV